MVKQRRRHSGAGKQLALLAYVHRLLPKSASIFLVGDCEFGSVEVLQKLDKWQWFYVLRQKLDTCIRLNRLNEWRTLGSFVQNPGQSV